MILIAGLGNPGEKYKNTRHNVGFIALDALAQNFGIDFQEDRKRNAETATYTMTFPGQKKKVRIVLVKPTTFMNNSGEAIEKVRKYFGILPSNVWVIHDDLDVDLGSIRIRKGGSSAGQKGVESTERNLGTPSFVRFRVGIRPNDTPPEGGHKQPRAAETFVLERFSKSERQIIDTTIDSLIETIHQSCDKGIEITTL